MGRREKFLSEAVDQLRADGVAASFITGDVRWAPLVFPRPLHIAYIFADNSKLQRRASSIAGWPNPTGNSPSMLCNILRTDHVLVTMTIKANAKTSVARY